MFAASKITEFRNMVHLLKELTLQDLRTKTQGNIFEWAWLVLIPVASLSVYTFVFSEIFKVRWGGTSGDKFSFAERVFTGLICFAVFSEPVGRASALIASNANLVKKVVFPLGVLPVMVTLSALFNALLSLAVLLVFSWLVTGSLKLTAVLIPLMWLPLVMITLGAVFLVSATSVYIRDLGQVVSVAITMLMFLSAVFFSVEQVPEAYRGILSLNPLVGIIEGSRLLLFEGKVPPLSSYMMLLVSSGIVLAIGRAWFRFCQAGFADVL